jgi:hypothetical protein
MIHGTATGRSDKAAEYVKYKSESTSQQQTKFFIKITVVNEDMAYCRWFSNSSEQASRKEHAVPGYTYKLLVV